VAAPKLHQLFTSNNSTESIVNISGNGGYLFGLGAKLFDFLVLAAGIAAVIYLIWYGIQYITAGGSPEKVKAARTGVINTVIGIVIIFCAFGLVTLAYKITSIL